MRYQVGNIPVQIIYRGLKSSRGLTDRIQQRVAWLEHFSKQLISCRVLVEAPPPPHRGNLYSVRIHLRLPGGDLVVGRKSSLRTAHKDVHQCIRDAFDEARREVEDFERRRSYFVKTPRKMNHGVVVRLVDNDGGYGFIEDQDGREFFFHAHSVLGNRYDRLVLGTEVKFSEKEGDEGPQATSVRAVGKQGRQFPANLRKTA